MSRYATIQTFMWHDEKLRSLPEDARILFYYLLTSPHGNMIGLFYLPELYACSDLQWEQIRYRMGIDTLCDAQIIAVERDIIWVKNYLKHNTIKGEKQVSGAVNRLTMLPSTKLIKPFLKELRKHLSEADWKRFNELYTYPNDTLSDTLCDTPSITGTGTESGTVSESGSGSAAQTPTEKPDDDDDVKHFVSEVTKEFAVAFGYPPNQTQMEMLMSFTNDGMMGELILEALKRSAQNGAKGPTYTKAILQSWLNKGALTMVDVERLDGVLSRQTPSNRTGETAAERLLREEIERERAEADIIDIAWSEGG